MHVLDILNNRVDTTVTCRRELRNLAKFRAQFTDFFSTKNCGPINNS